MVEGGGMGIGPDLKARTDQAIEIEKQRTKHRSQPPVPERFRQEFEHPEPTYDANDRPGMVRRIWRRLRG